MNERKTEEYARSLLQKNSYYIDENIIVEEQKVIIRLLIITLKIFLKIIAIR